jgi:hypothetical protein
MPIRSIRRYLGTVRTSVRAAYIPSALMALGILSMALHSLAPITFALAGLLALKTSVPLQTLRWLRTSGRDHRETIEKSKKAVTGNNVDPRPEDAFASFAKTGNRVVPWGVKDYKLRRRINELAEGGRVSRFHGSMLHWFRCIFFTYTSLAFVVPLYLLAIAGNAWDAHPTALKVGTIAVTTILMALNMAIIAEMLLGYVFLRDYGYLFHLQTKAAHSHAERLFTEFRTIGFVLVALVTTNTAGVFVARTDLDAFQGRLMDDEVVFDLDAQTTLASACSPSLKSRRRRNRVELAIASMYFTSTSLATVGYGDLSPANCPGAVFAMLLHLQGTAFFVLVLSAFWGTRTPSSGGDVESTNS